MATVVSGTWQFGYAKRFDAQTLKSLPAGSVYSEPAEVNHFARTETEPVLVEISGFGPTDTRYVDPANTPKARRTMTEDVVVLVPGHRPFGKAAFAAAQRALDR